MEKKIPTVLVVEDEVRIAGMITDYLSRHQFSSVVAYNGVSALESLKEREIDIMLLDWMMPEMSGIELLERLNQEDAGVFTTDLRHLPIIMLTAKEAEGDKIEGLLQGADDYMTKPFSLKELLARIRAHLRRREKYSHLEVPRNIIKSGDISLDLKKRQGYQNSQEIKLTSLQFDLLSFFCLSPEQVFTRDQLMSEIASTGFYESFERTIDAHIKNLRKVVEEIPAQPKHIITVRGIGYKFVP